MEYQEESKTLVDIYGKVLTENEVRILKICAEAGYEICPELGDFELRELMPKLRAFNVWDN